MFGYIVLPTKVNSQHAKEYTTCFLLCFSEGISHKHLRVGIATNFNELLEAIESLKQKKLP